MFKEAIKFILEPIVNIANEFYLEKYYSKIAEESTVLDIDLMMSTFDRVLIISPHQDDESIGAGGTIAKMTKRGTSVDIIYLTDGRLDKNDFKNSKIRLEEAEKVSGIYGFNKSLTLNFINKTLPNNIEKLTESIERNVELEIYDAIFLTGPYECNDDHFASYQAVYSLVEKDKTKENVQFYLYDINNSIQGKILNCISKLIKEELEKKWKSYDIFQSQKYITFSTLKIMDKKKLRVDKNFDRGKYVAAEIFSKLNKEEFITKGKNNNTFRRQLHTATSSVRFIKYLESNKKYRSFMK